MHQMIPTTLPLQSNRTAPFVAPPAPRPPLADLFALQGTVMPFERNGEIYAEEEAAEYVYRVVTGTVRVCKLLSDGRRQIETFHRAGDVFGLEAGATHDFSAEAVTACTIALIKRSTVFAAAERDGDVARALWSLASRALQRSQKHLLLLGRKTAQERVAAFLVDLAAGNAVDLPMSRQDMADYLGLTIETVSRTLTQLENADLIALPTARRIILRNAAALRDLDA